MIGFERGAPVSLDGVPTPLHQMLPELDGIVGAYGFGRIDMVENRRVGIKSREVYECPGVLALLLAHADLESITLERDVMREKSRLETRWAETVYDGLWYSPLREAFDAFVESTQRHVTGEVRLRLQPGQCTVVGRRAERGPLRLLARHLRGRRRVPPRGRGRIRAAVGPVGRDVVEAPAHRGTRGPAPGIRTS